MVSQTGYNPYVVGPPVNQAPSFVGREAIIAWVGRELGVSTNVLVLLGQRRIGKTSLLKYLEHYLPRDRFLPIYFDLQGRERQHVGAVLADLARDLAEAANLEMEEVDSLSWDDKGRTFQRHFLPRLYAALPPEVQPVLLLDEFDNLEQPQEALPSTVAARALRTYLARLIASQRRLAFVFVVGRHRDDLSIDFTQVFKSALMQEIWVLERTDAIRLIHQGESSGRLRFDDNAINHILTLTGGHPYLTQLLGQRLWDRAGTVPEAIPFPVTSAAVEEAATEALRMGGHVLDWWWDGLGPAEKIYAAVLAELSPDGGDIPEDKIIEALSQHAARLHTREVEMAPHDLVRRRVLVEVGERRYRFAIELLRRWVRANRPLAAVKDEIDRIDDVAQQFFKLGERLFRRREWAEAAAQFERALGRNPHHFRAHLLLGETLLEQADVARAVQELEQAYALDRSEARLPLVRALLRQASQAQAAGEDETALALYDRVLSLSPQEQTARQGQRTIWEQRGDQALASQDYATALAAFERAGLPDKVERTRQRQREQALAEGAQAAGRYMAQEEWAEAEAAYKRLLEIESGNAAWIDSLEQARSEKEMSERYAEAAGYVQQGAWEKARPLLGTILGQRPTYRNTAELLVLANRRQRPHFLARLSYQIWVGSLLLVALGLGSLWLSSRGQTTELRTQVASQEITIAALETIQQNQRTEIASLWTPTLTPTPTPTSISTPPSTPTPMEESVRSSDGALMVRVPAGSFTMGSAADDGEADSNEKPAHAVQLDAFWLDKFEVTNFQYAACVQTGVCSPSDWVNDTDYNGQTQPVVGVDWNDAFAYCQWAGARLPTEAEWEYAARGPENRLYPWGDTFDAALVNGSGSIDGFDRPAPVGSFPSGASWVGAQDMAGNVWEWVNDWYAADYYAQSPSINPQGPEDGNSKVLRGGSWNNHASLLRAAHRYPLAPDNRYDLIGFRCLLSAQAPDS